MIARIRKKKWIVPTWLKCLFFMGLGFLFIVFEDDYDETDLYIILLLSYTLLVIFLLARWIFNQVRLVIQLKNEQAKTELVHLQSQVNPHFFFNILNNLYGWVEKDPKQAQAMILKLSDMMRYSIYDGQKELVTLEEEIVYLKNYIALHKMRYLKKIDTSFVIDIQKEGCKIRPLLFIILLENAFKHGVENLRKNAYVHIVITAQEKDIYCSIENNFDSEIKGTTAGIGLKNLRRRLELVYPNQHTLEIVKEATIYKAQLSIHQ